VHPSGPRGAAGPGQAVRQSPDGYFNKICAFFAIEIGPRMRNYYSPRHSPEWVSIDDAVPMIAEEASVWAVQRYLDLHHG
jgi:hypothetical protein